MSEWEILERARPPRGGGAGFGAVRLALLFGTGAVALALIATPVLDKNTRARGGEVALAGELDLMSTGTVARAGGSLGGNPGGSYVIRRSVLQPRPDSVCVLHAGGAQSGDC